MVALWVVLGIVVLALLYAVYMYNRLVRLRVRTENAWSQIDVQLKRRHDLIPNLVQSVKGYADHEREVFEDVTNARAAAQAASGPQTQGAAETQLTRSLSKLIAVAERYPDLKASQNFLALQEELTGTESKIAYARQFYNDEVAALNTRIQSFPSSLIARAGHFQPKEFFETEDVARGPVAVQL